ncbi:protein 5NUC-like [Tropilaelaps mercedesae]|uniref:Protein 5NUC-like n=1 Tax=Tropilaelaps mercedesae TaxID=418985 RepID=A0A1V9XQ85_9ACAR|nr:protein 5NUC-like [Tropilaelaps mercedesae]
MFGVKAGLIGYLTPSMMRSSHVVDLGTDDRIGGLYPTMGNRRNQSFVLVVQDFWVAKYFGHIQVTFDETMGNVRSRQGMTPILLDYSIPKGKWNK